MMNRKVLFSLLSLLFAAILLIACAVSGSNGAQQNETEASVSTVGEFTVGEPGANDQNPPPEPPDGMGEPPQGGPCNPPQGEPPQGGPGNPPQGEPPQGGPGGQPPEGMGNPPAGGPGGSAASVSYTAANEITSSASESGKTYASTTADENALLISTAEAVTVTDPTVTKTGDSNGGDACNFYGLNAAVLCKDGASVTIEGARIETAASGANGVFCYGGNGGRNGADGDGTTVTISDSVITTTGSGSGGIMTAGGGVTIAKNLTVTTSGQSSAPIRTDRGGGTVTVEGGAYTSNGLGSPAIYSTAEITVSDAALTSNLSEGVVIEGKNSVVLKDCALSANNTQRNGNAAFLDSVMLYQSMSGDADTGTSLFSMTGGTLKSLSGHVFHVTNTNAVINLSGVAIENDDPANVLLSVCADGWSGAKNVAALNAKGQTLSGTILVGSDSELTLTLSEGSAFTGAVSGEIVNAKGETVSSEVGTVHVVIDGSSTWTLTADTYLTSFTGDVSSVVTGGFALYVNGERIA